jgi:hypothetical protein
MVNTEFERMWMESIVALFVVVTRNLSGGMSRQSQDEPQLRNSDLNKGYAKNKKFLTIIQSYYK